MAKSSKQKAGSASASTRRAARAPLAKLNDIGPFYTIYLYRVGIVNGQIALKEMYHHFDRNMPVTLGTNLATVVGGMIDRIRADDGHYPDMGDKFAEMVRRRKGFCVLVVEGNATLESIRIYKQNGGRYRYNYQNYGLLDVRVTSGGTLKVAYWVDHMIDSEGDLEDEERQKPKIKYGVKGRGFRDIEELEESGGTNMGPPLKPPGRKLRLKVARATAAAA